MKRHALRACRWLAQVLIVLPVFERIAPKGACLWLDRQLTILARFAVDYIFFQAVHIGRVPLAVRNPFQVAQAARRHDVRQLVHYSLRAAIGGAARRAVKARGVAARARAILSALRNVSALAARLARRAGLSRRASAQSCVRNASCANIAPVASAAPGCAALYGLCADTS